MVTWYCHTWIHKTSTSNHCKVNWCCSIFILLLWIIAIFVCSANTLIFIDIVAWWYLLLNNYISFNDFWSFSDIVTLNFEWKYSTDNKYESVFRILYNKCNWTLNTWIIFCHDSNYFCLHSVVPQSLLLT